MLIHKFCLILTIHIGLGLLGELLQIFIDYFDLNEWTYPYYNECT